MHYNQHTTITLFSSRYSCLCERHYGIWENVAQLHSFLPRHWMGFRNKLHAPAVLSVGKRSRCDCTIGLGIIRTTIPRSYGPQPGHHSHRVIPGMVWFEQIWLNVLTKHKHLTGHKTDKQQAAFTKKLFRVYWSTQHPSCPTHIPQLCHNNLSN